MKPQILILTALFFCLLLATCRKDNPSSPEPDPRPPENPEVASQEISPDGGEITSKDGNLTLTIPAGALGNTETITIEEITEDDLGSEFDELSEALSFEKAYELGPDGLQFDKPITASIQSEQSPIQEDDSLGIFAEFLFTSSNGTVETLDSLRTEVDSDEGTVQISGQMKHFTPLVGGAAKEENNGVQFTIGGPFNPIEVGNPFNISIEISDFATGPLGELVTVLGPAMYLDESRSPVTPTFDGAPSAEIPSLNGDRSSFFGTFSYMCSETGLGIYESESTVKVQFDLDSGPITATSFANFITTVECVEAPPPLINLQVALEGEGSGTVKSDLEGIDCPEDCNEEYERGTAVILTATPDEGSIFTGWSGEAPDDCSDDADCAIAVDDNRNEITATFVSEDASSSNLLVDLYILSEEYGLTLPEALSLLSNPFFSGGNSTEKHAKFAQQSQQNEVQFGDLTGTFPLAIAGAEGYVVIDLLDGEVLLDETDINNTGPLFGVVGATQEPPGAGSMAMLLGFGGSDYVLHRNTTGGSFSNTNPIVFNGETAFDAFPAGGNPVSDVVSFVQPFSGVGFYVYDDAQDLYVPAEIEFDASLFENRELVSAYVHDDILSDHPVPQPRGPVLVLTREAESGVYLAKWDGSNPVRAIDNIGFDARKIRCIDDGSGTGNLVCVASIFGHDRLGLLTWDGENLPTLTDFAEVGDGPVGIDLRLLDNGNIAVVSTGFNDNTVTVTELRSSGSVVSNNTRAVLEGCQSPGHAIFVQDEESLKIVGTCYDSSNYFVMESEL